MGRIRFKPTHGGRLARVRRKNMVGMAIVVLTAVLIMNHVLFGQPMRVEGDSMSPAVRDGDFIYVQYGRGAPGEIVVVEHDDLRVLRRLVGLEGDRVEVGPRGVTRNGLKLIPMGVKFRWDTLPKLPTGITGSRMAPAEDPEVTPVEPNHVYVACDLPRHCRKSDILGQIPVEKIKARVVGLWSRHGEPDSQPAKAGDVGKK